MTTRIINDPASLERQGLLLAAFEATAAEWTARADRLHQVGDTARLETALTIAYGARETASRIRLRMAAAVEADQPPGLVDVLSKLPDEKFSQIAPSADDPEREPPHQLVPFVAWLRLKLGRHLPWVPSHLWQAVGAALLGYRPTGGAR